MRLLLSNKATLALALVLMLVGNYVAQAVQTDDEEEDADVNEEASGSENPLSEEVAPDTTMIDRKPASSTPAPVDPDDDDNEDEDAEGSEELGPEPAPVQSKDDDLNAPGKEIVPALDSSTPPQVTYQSTRSKLLAIISKPGILAGIVGGAVIGILTAILLIMFIVYRMRKKDEGSYALEETKKPLNAYDYRHCPTKEFYA